MDSDVTVHAYNRANYLARKIHEQNPQADMDQMKRLGKALFEVLEPFYKENVKKYQPLIGNLMSSLKNEKYRDNIQKQLDSINEKMITSEMDMCTKVINSWMFKENLETPIGN